MQWNQKTLSRVRIGRVKLARSSTTSPKAALQRIALSPGTFSNTVCFCLWHLYNLKSGRHCSAFLQTWDCDPAGVSGSLNAISFHWNMLRMSSVQGECTLTAHMLPLLNQLAWHQQPESQSNVMILHSSVVPAMPAAKQIDPDRTIILNFTHSMKPG